MSLVGIEDLLFKQHGQIPLLWMTGADLADQINENTPEGFPHLWRGNQQRRDLHVIPPPSEQCRDEEIKVAHLCRQIFARTEFDKIGEAKRPESRQLYCHRD